MSDPWLFADRHTAGLKLATAIQSALALEETSAVSPIVFALPKGGIPVAVPIAVALKCPLEIIVAKKITPPHNSELAIGAITSGKQVLWMHRGEEKTVPFLASPTEQQLVLEQAHRKAKEQWQALHQACPWLRDFAAETQDLSDRVALLVDDGIATGMTMAVALKALQHHHPAQIWICAPVAPRSLGATLEKWCDRAIVLATPQLFLSVGRFYGQFAQVEMAEAITCLESVPHPQGYATSEEPHLSSTRYA